MDRLSHLDHPSLGDYRGSMLFLCLLSGCRGCGSEAHGVGPRASPESASGIDRGFIRERAGWRADNTCELPTGSIDFLEDAAVNFLILTALEWSPVRRARVGMALSGILLIPGLATLWTAWGKFNVSVPPIPVLLSLLALVRLPQS